MADIMRSDVIILGAGLVGSALAVALARGGVSSIVVDPAQPDAIRDTRADGRASAVSSSSWRMMKAIGVLDHFAAEASPIEQIQVGEQGAHGFHLVSPEVVLWVEGPGAGRSLD